MNRVGASAESSKMETIAGLKKEAERLYVEAKNNYCQSTFDQCLDALCSLLKEIDDNADSLSEIDMNALVLFVSSDIMKEKMRMLGGMCVQGSGISRHRYECALGWIAQLLSNYCVKVIGDKNLVGDMTGAVQRKIAVAQN